MRGQGRDREGNEDEWRIGPVTARRRRTAFYAAAVEGRAREADLRGVSDQAAEVVAAHTAAPREYLTFAPPHQERLREVDLATLQSQCSQ